MYSDRSAFSSWCRYVVFCPIGSESVLLLWLVNDLMEVVLLLSIIYIYILGSYSACELAFTLSRRQSLRTCKSSVHRCKHVQTCTYVLAIRVKYSSVPLHNPPPSPRVLSYTPRLRLQPPSAPTRAPPLQRYFWSSGWWQLGTPKQPHPTSHLSRTQTNCHKSGIHHTPPFTAILPLPFPLFDIVSLHFPH
jgi:hypothetical protein